MEWYFLFRLVIATLLGTIIGYERKLRVKEAGLRTHAIVALGASLITMLSIFAFDGGDKSRVAAQIVSGVGFLGAGMIMFKRQSVHGLTTAAGIWVTAGVGMAIGAGMYILGVGTAVLIVIIQYVLHLPLKILKKKKYAVLKVVFENVDGHSEKINELFNIKSFIKLKAVKEDDTMLFTATFVTDKILTVDYISEVLSQNEYIKSIERLEED